MTQKHPDFEQEQERLTYTKHYMQQLLDESKRDVKSAQENIRHAMADLDYLDSSLSYMNILTNARFFEMARSQKEGLEAIQQKPYFARIHFQKDGEDSEMLYIGKTSLFHRETQEPIIVDWRSPVANVYYDGRLGDIEYDVREDTFTGHLFSKRQYTIEKGELQDVRDIDLTTNDELLQEALSGKADVRLTEIVSTIQAEQNEIIRAHLKQPIIVQGAAGSGKTTIALHRISYFLYTMGEHFPAEKLMILAPSKLFMDYIADVLPELGVGQICQTTYTEYVLNATGIKVKLKDVNLKLAALTEQENPDEMMLWQSQMKGSLSYTMLVDAFLYEYEKSVADQFEDVYIEKYCIMRGSKLRNLFLTDFSYMPIEKRLERIKMILTSHVRQKKKEILIVLNKKYDAALDKALVVRDDAKRKAEVTKFIDERDRRIPLIEKESKTTANAYMRRFKKANIKNMYREFVTNEKLINEHATLWTEEQKKAFLQSHSIESWEIEDLAPLYYMHAKIKGISDKWKMRVVFIDEVQDYSVFQLAALKEGLGTDMFTMVGDLAQGIHSYWALTSWDPIIELFPRATYTTLQKSYRTTIEIMEMANSILMQMDEDLPLVEPVVRHGIDPQFHEMKTIDGNRIVTLLDEVRSRGHRSIALICKTTTEAKAVAKHLEDFLPIQLLSDHSDIDQEKLLIVPSHLAKGLEFDAVIVVAFDTPFREHAIDRKLLYVAMTRPMHELHLVGPNREHFLLPAISKKS
ncbi:AAA family ATPase [Paenisporosarcina quisquiliarum]|uniref:AAA family ATPase n=1 Tax=Paenisporosarcina quisquiliarum TaxID=365346 RepID=A0A9X3RDY8_9BACL|nr:RNA polymerase recycling motor HelD [Paenisporosarcina quisquiliarum]MCZ8538051.1 AAA family ATPase [Paenisporosarcina quisquiliarum]